MKYFVCLLLVWLCFAPVAWAELLTGRVVGPKGKPVAGAQVVVRVRNGPYRELGPVSTNFEGAFSVNVGKLAREKPPTTPGFAPRVIAAVVVLAPGLAPGGTEITEGTTFGTIRLGPVGPGLRGAVLAPDGTPAVGVFVRVTSINTPVVRGQSKTVFLTPAFQAAFCTVTGPDGSFALGGLPAEGSVYVGFEDERFVGQSLSGLLKPEMITLPTLMEQPGSTMAGVVLDTDGKPLKGVRVGVLETRSTNSPVRRAGTYVGAAAVTTNETGAFRLIGLEAGTYTLRAEAKQGTFGQRGIVVVEGETVAVPPLRLTQDTKVSGRVLDSDTGKSVFGVYVAAESTDENRNTFFSISKATDKDGRFSFDLPPGATSIQLFQTDQMHPIIVGANRFVATLKSGQTADIVFWVSRGNSVEGIVEDEFDKPVKNVSVTAITSAYGGGYSGPTVRTDKSGHWKISGLSAREFGFGVTPGVIGTTEFPVPTEGPIRFVVRPEKRGEDDTEYGSRVTDTAGRAVSEAWVTVDQPRFEKGVPLPVGIWPRGVFRTDGAGRFSVPFTDNRYEVQTSARKNGYRWIGTRHFKRYVPPNTVLVPTPHCLAGVVVDANGNPVISALVASPQAPFGEQTRTDAQGRFSLPHVSDGNVMVFAGAGRAWGQAQIQAESRNVVVVVAPLAPNPVQDAERAVQILQAGGYTTKRAASTIVPYVPELEKYGSIVPLDDATVVQTLRARIDREPQIVADWGRARLSFIKDPYTRRDVGRYIVRALICLNRSDEARAFYATLENAPPPSHLRIANQIAEAALAAALHRADAEQLVREALTVIQLTADTQTVSDGLTRKERYSALVADLATNNVALALQTAASIEGQAHVFTADYRRVALSEAALRIASLRPGDAQRLINAAYQNGDDWESPILVASMLRSIEAAAKSDPENAARLARSVTHPAWRTLALATAARGQAGKKRNDLLREAVRAAEVWPEERPWLLFRIAALAFDADPKAAELLFAEAWKRLQHDVWEHPHRAHGNRGLVGFAFCLARLRPGESRVLLEEAWARSKAALALLAPDEDLTDVEDFTAIARYMAAVDIDRALEMAEGNNEIRRHIAFYLARPPGRKQAVLPLLPVRDDEYSSGD